MSPCHPFRPVPGQCGPNRRGPLPAPPFNPQDYWATRKLVSQLSASLGTKLDRADVVDPGAAAEAGEAADAKGTYEGLVRVLAKLAEKADRATTLAGYGITDAATKEEIAAKADLVGGKVPAAQLPSYVDDVLEYGSRSEFPPSGEGGRIYVAKDTNLVYRWSGTQYVEISPSPVLDGTVTAASPNGVRSSGIWSWVKSLLPRWLTGDYAEPATVASVEAKADKSALDAHVADTGNPHGVTAAQVNAYTKAETDAKLAGKLDTRGKLVWDDAQGSLILGDDETSVDTKRLRSFGKARFYGSLEVAEDWGHVVLTDGDTPIETLPEFVTNVVDRLSDGVVRTNEHGDAVLHALQTTDGEGHPTGVFIGDNGAGDGISVSIPGSAVVNPLNVYASPSPDPSVTGLGWGVYGLVDPRSIEFITGCTLQSLLDEKANRPVDFDSTHAGNLAALTADGDLADSGKTVDDFLAKDGDGQVEDAVFPDPYYGLRINPGGLGVQSFASWLRSGEWFDYTVTFLNVYYFQKITCGNIEVGNDGYGSADITPIISATNPTFSNAVLAVGLNIDTNSVAVLNEIAATFGGFPIEGTATTVGGLLAALAAAAAWLKKNKVGAFASVGGATATVENGVAKLDGFFTNSNSLLTGTIDARLPYPLYAVPSTGLLKDRAINTTSLASVTVPDNFTDLLIRASVASSLSVTMPTAIATKYGDTFPGEAGEYLITITKTGAAEAYVRTIKLEEVA